MTQPIVKPSFVVQKWNFRVSVQGLAIGYFEMCSGLKAAFDMTEVHAGGEVDPVLIQPGKRKHDPLVLSSGSSDNNELWTWYDGVRDVEGEGKDLTELQRKVTIDLFHRDKKTIKKTWVVNAAVPAEFEAGDFDANSSDNVIEKLTLRYINFTKG